MKYLVCAALCAASLAAVAAPAKATTIIVTYAGKVSSGLDIDGLFGVAGANLKKKDYTLSFTTDTSGFHSDIDSPYGYSMIDYCCSVVATLTIGQDSYTIAGSSEHTTIAEWTGSWGGYDYQINANAEATNGDWSNASVGSLYNFFGDLGLTTPLSHTVSNNDDAYSAAFQGGATNLILKVSSMTVEVVSSPAPEPATWALMIGGFGAIGLVMRRARRLSVRFA